MCLVWLADEGDKVVDVLNRAHISSQIQLANAMREADLVERFSEGYETLVDTVNTVVPKGTDERLLKVQHLLDAYGLKDLKVYYQAESRFSHPSLTAIGAFAHGKNDGLALHQRPRFEQELASCQEFCLMVLVVAMQAFNEMLTDKPWGEELAGIAEAHGPRPDLPKRTK
jgi:hypothetical protein